MQMCKCAGGQWTSPSATAEGGGGMLSGAHLVWEGYANSASFGAFPIHSVWSPGPPFTGKAYASEDEHSIQSTNY